jgi:hypothetical protein
LKKAASEVQNDAGFWLKLVQQDPRYAAYLPDTLMERYKNESGEDIENEISVGQLILAAHFNGDESVDLWPHLSREHQLFIFDVEYHEGPTVYELWGKQHAAQPSYFPYNENDTENMYNKARVKYLNYLSDTIKPGEPDLKLKDKRARVLRTYEKGEGPKIPAKDDGKHKFSEISPKKSIEGCIGGTVGSVIIALIYAICINKYASLNISYLYISIIAAVLSICSQLGDLSASSIKRTVGIKDFGNLIPGHGGMLDRIDSIIFIAPFAYFLLTLI